MDSDFISSLIKKNKPILNDKNILLDVVNQVSRKLEMKTGKDEFIEITSPPEFYKKDVILLLLSLKELSFTEIQILMGGSYVSGLFLIYRKRSESGNETGLEVENLVKRIPNKKVQITEKGIEYVKSLILTLYQKQVEIEKKEAERKALDTKAEKYTSFFRDHYQEEILKGRKTITIDFPVFTKYDFKLAESILDNPVQEITLMKNVYFSLIQKKKDLTTTDINIFFIHLPKFEGKIIGEKRVQDIDRMIRIVGQVIRNSEVLPHTSISIYKCPNCGANINVIQKGEIYREPKVCPNCGRKGKFIEIGKKYDDIQFLMVEELAEHLNQRIQQQTLKLILHGELCSIENQPAFEDSIPLVFNGILKENPNYLGNNNHSTSGKYVMDVVGIEIPENLRRFKVTKKREKEFKEFANQKDFHEKLRTAFLPFAHDRDLELDALFLGLVSGGDPRQARWRDDAHILFVGDPGVMKSTMLKKAQQIIAGSRWISGKGTSSAGLLGTVTKDLSFGGSPTLEKGALPLANQNVALVDELDKMDENELNSLNEALSNQTISINKWNKHATFKTDCTVVAAANPVSGHFDKMMSILDQIALPRPLVDRFDIVIPIFDTVNRTDVKLSSNLMNRFDEDLDIDEEEHIDFLREYFYYARSMPHPKLDHEAGLLLQKYWINLRAASVIHPDLHLSITPREMNGLLRLARAHCKLRLSTKLTVEDAKFVINLKSEVYKRIGLILTGNESKELNMSRKEKVNQEWLS